MAPGGSQNIKFSRLLRTYSADITALPAKQSIQIANHHHHHPHQPQHQEEAARTSPLFRTRSENLTYDTCYKRATTTTINSQELPPVDRYFHALKGPELDILNRNEDTLLPRDEKWAFLLRFPINSFGMCLGLGSQAILWKLLHTSPAMKFLHIPAFIPLIVWILALTSLIIVFFTYLLKCIFYHEAVRREYYHPVRVNFFFAPWISSLFLLIGVPSAIATHVHSALFWAFMAPITMLELKIYGQWLSGGERKLSKVANPSLHLSIVGNFVGAIAGALVDVKEVATFYWSVGVAHYLVLFVTLYQRLPTNEALPRELHPVFFLFIAAPSAASVGWGAIQGSFDNMSRIAYFIALFLFTSLVVRIKLFYGFKFTIAWWAYSFPTTAVTIATIKYTQEVTNGFTKGVSVLLSFTSSMGVFTLLILTVLHGCFWRTLFPNDMAIAITPLKKAKKKANKIRKKECNV